ncbi:MAG: hypothetical protein JWQ23_1189 [Herminiimonas sp.]|jgi:hypothetical protein|nr:hypothetical protein [Herminiimonas sp.]
MGVCMAAQTLSDEKISIIMADPPQVWLIVDPDDSSMYLKEIGQSKPPGILSRLIGQKKEWPPRIPAFDYAENERHELDMDKSWDGINYCLKQLISDGQCKNLFEDGMLVGDVEVGYGPAMCLISNEVAAIAREYDAISGAELLAQFIPSKMKGVYPEGIWSEDRHDRREYLTEYFAALKTFLKTAASHKLGILVQYT